MGYNTTVVVLNDSLHEIERDPEFGKKLARAIRELDAPEEYRTTYLHGAQVVETHHADGLALIAVGGNLGRFIGIGHYRDDDEALLKAVTRQIKRRSKEQNS